MRLKLEPSDSTILRTKAKPVTDPASLGSLIDDLIETMVAEGGVGLAAPQVGQSMRVFVTGLNKRYKVFINPELSNFSTEQIWWEEGCLSLPRLLGDVERPRYVTVNAIGRDGKPHTVTADKLMARVLQHEFDHLEGILFPDRMRDLKLLRNLTEEEWQSRYEDRQAGKEPSKQAKNPDVSPDGS